MHLAVWLAALSLLHRRLSGGWALEHLYDEIRLTHASFEALARASQSNPRRSDIIVCLTSIPSRLERLQLTLKSLFRQTMAPQRIRLHLPSHSLREDRPYVLPPWLTNQALEIVTTPDFGPATKLFPALQLGPRQSLLVLDDDRIYPPRLVEELHSQRAAYPDTILCAGGWRVPADLTDRPTTLRAVLTGQRQVPCLGSNLRRARPVDILQGTHGYLAEPRMFADMLDYSGAPPQAFTCDDVWISAHALVPLLVVPLSRCCFTPWAHRVHYRRTSLARNFNFKANVEERSNTILLRHFAARWNTQGGP